MDIEVIGGAATEGLVASAFETPTGRAGDAHAVCADCGTETVGRFCHNCGNPSHIHRTLLHLGEELLHGVMHFDSRTWRTLPMLVFRPGRLTREWVEGKRARYVSPLAIFLFTIFIMFMLLSYMPAPKERPLLNGAASAVAERRVAIAAAREELAKASPEKRVLAEAALKAAETGQAQIRTDAAGNVDVSYENLSDAIADAARKDQFDLDLGSNALNEKVRHKLENPQLALYKLQQTFYKFSFLLVPISIPFVALLFLWRRSVTLYDHGVFILYSLTFMSLLTMMVALLLRLNEGLGGFAAACVPAIVPAHMFFQLKGAYGLGLASTLWRTALLLIFASIALILFVLAVIWLGLA